MPVYMEALAVKSTSVDAFTESNAYDDLAGERLIQEEFDKDGSKLYVIGPSRGGIDTNILDELPPEDFVYVVVDSNDNKLRVAGEWLDHPFDLSGSDRMVLMVRNLDQDKVDNFKSYYKVNENPDYEDDSTDPKREKCCYDLGLDTDMSTDSVFIAYFEPDLNPLLECREWLEEEIAELSDEYGDDFAHTVFANHNYEVLEEVFAELDLDDQCISSSGCFTAEGYGAPNDFTEYVRD